MMSEEDIRGALAAKQIILDPVDLARIEPASYDARVGNWAFSSSSKEKLNLTEKGVLVIEPGEFAVLETRERVELDNQTTGQLGLRSEFAQRGLLMLSGPQIDPTFCGVLTVRVVNLAPKRIALPYESPFLTIQFFRLSNPVGHVTGASGRGKAV
jgi:deoxycytidine triphosphate deaminase